MTNTLEREFGIKGGIAMVACTQIGSGIFMSPQGIVNIVGSIGRRFGVSCLDDESKYRMGQ